MRQMVKMHLYGSCPGFRGRFPYFGTRVYFPHGSIIFRGACEHGIFESDNIRILTELAKPGTWYFDVGANIGLLAIPVLRSTARVHVASFEASPSVVGHLQRTARESPWVERWNIVAKAVGGTKGKAEFSCCAPSHSALDGLRATGRSPATATATVEVTTLDEEWKSRGRPGVSVIKLDIEGGEMDALEGARELVLSQRPAVMLEWHSTNLLAYGVEVPALLAFAGEMGYRLCALPSLVRVETERELRMHMTTSENFLLYDG